MKKMVSDSPTGSACLFTFFLVNFTVTGPGDEADGKRLTHRKCMSLHFFLVNFTVTGPGAR
jgi:hypothetical protein